MQKYQGKLLSENENTTHQNLWNAVKAMLRKEKFTVQNAYIGKKKSKVSSQ